MPAFDPKAATDAYLAAFPAAAHLKAIHYTQGGHWLLLWGWLVSVMAYIVIARLRLLESVQGALQRRRRRPWLTALVVAMVFFVADAVLELPWNVYANWWRERSYGLTSQPFAGWLGEAALTTAIGAVFIGLFFMALYALIRRAPRTWWIWAGGLAAVFFVVQLILEPVLIEPLFNRYTPAPPGATRDAVAALAKQAGVPSD
jgi:STE24 endopeptidase